MIQHIYDLHGTVYLSSPVTDLMFHINVFAAGDKYDVPSLRVLVVSKFTHLMKERWSTSQQEFCTVIRHLCGQNAVSLANTSLRKSAAAICVENIRGLIQLDTFVHMLEACGPFAAYLLTSSLRNKRVIDTFKCQVCILRPPRREPHDEGCFKCGAPDTTLRPGGAGKLLRCSIMEL
jgi:hypothetical protein